MVEVCLWMIWNFYLKLLLPSILLHAMHDKNTFRIAFTMNYMKILWKKGNKDTFGEIDDLQCYQIILYVAKECWK